MVVTAVDVSFTWICELTLDGEGRISAWARGQDCAVEAEHADGIEDVPSGVGWRDVEGGFYHGCALDADGHATCWGSDSAEWPPPAEERFTQLSADVQSTCGITTDGYLRCWAGEAWDDWGVDSNEGWMPEDAPTTDGWVKVDVQTDYACAIDIRGQVHCFGDTPIRGSLESALANPVDTPPNSAYLPPPE